MASTPATKCVEDILYRPFDKRRIFYRPSVVWRPRGNLMPTMQQDNLAVCTTRSVEIGRGWEHVFCANGMIQHHTVSLKEVNYLLPLYLYPGKVKHYGSAGFWPRGKDGRRPNLAPDAVDAIAAKLSLTFVPDGQGDLTNTFGPEDLFHYTYAVFHCPTYRARYAEFLKVDFARLPLTADRGVFACLIDLGHELVGLHLLEDVPDPEATYPQAGDNIITRTGKSAFKPPTSQAPGRVYVNDHQYFENVPPEIWGFHVGGYQVCEKWLKDRKGRTLGYDEIEHYRKVTEALRQTIRLMAEIDKAIPSWPLT